MDAPGAVTLGLRTPGLAVPMANLRHGGQLRTPFGRWMIAAGTIAKVGPIVALPPLLSQRYRTWQEMGFLPAFPAIVGAIAGTPIMHRCRSDRPAGGAL